MGVDLGEWVGLRKAGKKFQQVKQSQHLKQGKGGFEYIMGTVHRGWGSAGVWGCVDVCQSGLRLWGCEYGIVGL